MKGEEEDSDEPDHETYISQALYELRFEYYKMDLFDNVNMKMRERRDCARVHEQCAEGGAGGRYDLHHQVPVPLQAREGSRGH